MVSDAFSAFNLYAHKFIKNQWTSEPLGVGKLEFNSSHLQSFPLGEIKEFMKSS